MKKLPKKFDDKSTEKKWQEIWLSNGVYNWDSNSKKESYVIDTPPPTISGSLHMGHIFSYTQTDFIARYKRMRGLNVFYPMGFDDNGLPTERLVEKEKKTKAHLHSREDFIKMCNETVEKYRVEFRDLFRSIALSVDWNQEYHTISDEVRKISQMSFLDLYNKKQAYRTLEPMFWDPADQTAIAQAEIEEKELDSFENYIFFGLITEEQEKQHQQGKKINWDDIEKVEIMTTRPELLPACVALMVHPDDVEKYKGKKAVTPLFQAIVPIVADEAVQKDKGTGVVMCCTFGDEQDVRWWKQHKLGLKIVLNKFGKLDFSQIEKTDAHEFYTAIDGKKADHQEANLSAKKTITKLLEENNLTAKEKKPIKHMVKCAERSGAAIEIIPTDQWFIRVLEHKEALKKKANECNWKPEFMVKRIEQWIDSLSWDWCISRQRYFGVPFPIWYSKRAGEEGKILLPKISQLPVNPITDLPEGYSKDEVTPDLDVMDTWATSSISPQISSKAITKEYAIDYDRHQKLFPADLRPQAHEIIRTWAFYTIVKAHLHENTIPWKNLMISGWCLAEDKTKMSKSKGNVVTPLAIIEENSADVVRYWASTSRLGADTAFSRDVLKVGKKLVNKLWNATKFASIHFNLIKEKPTTAKEYIEKGLITEPVDKWIISSLTRTIAKATEELDVYEYSLARLATEEFFWKDFCDNYLEIAKARTYNDEPQNQQSRLSAIYTIYFCLNAILKLFAPFTPHITEELYSHIFDENNSIHSQGNWPDGSDFKIDEESEKVGKYAVEILEQIRKIKAEANVSIKKPTITTISANAEIISKLKQVEKDLANVTSSTEIIYNNSGSEIAVSLKFIEEAIAV